MSENFNRSEYLDSHCPHNAEARKSQFAKIWEKLDLFTKLGIPFKNHKEVPHAGSQEPTEDLR